jgi:hypothetical protein
MNIISRYFSPPCSLPLSYSYMTNLDYFSKCNSDSGFSSDHILFCLLPNAILCFDIFVFFLLHLVLSNFLPRPAETYLLTLLTCSSLDHLLGSHIPIPNCPYHQHITSFPPLRHIYMNIIIYFLYSYKQQ